MEGESAHHNQQLQQDSAQQPALWVTLFCSAQVCKIWQPGEKNVVSAADQ